jgi:hypothetical protein
MLTHRAAGSSGRPEVAPVGAKFSGTRTAGSATARSAAAGPRGFAVPRELPGRGLAVEGERPDARAPSPDRVSYLRQTCLKP